MLRHSYFFEVKRLEVVLKALELDLLKRPDNQRAKIKIEETKKEIAWFRQKIDEGKDPGVIVL